MTLSRSPIGKKADDGTTSDSKQETTETFKKSKYVLNYPTGRLGSVTRKRNEIRDLLTMLPNIDFDLLNEMMSEMEERFEKFKEVCQAIFDDPDVVLKDNEEFQLWFDKHTNDINLFQHEVKNVIQQNVGKSNTTAKSQIFKVENQEDEISPNDSASNIGGTAFSRISQRSTSSIRAKLAEAQAKRLADKKFRAENEKLEKQRALLKEEKEIFYEKILLKQLDKIEQGKHRASDSVLSTVCSGKTVKSKATKSILKRKESESVVSDGRSELNPELALFLRTQEKARLPKNEPECFDGLDLTKYKSFIMSFEKLIAEKCDTDFEKICYLEKYTLALPRQLVASCKNADPSSGYKMAIKQLDLQYGNEYHISSAYIRKIEKFPLVKNEDAETLQKLSILLTGCLNVMHCMSSLNQLNNPTEMMKIVRKLPFRLREQWLTLTHRLTKNGKAVKFSHLCDFVQEQSSRLSQPIFSDIYDQKDSQSPGGDHVNKSTNKPQRRSFNTKIESTNAHENKEKRCPVCKKSNHALEKCFFFGKKSIAEKEKYANENKLCFACLNGQHLAKDCSKRSICSECSEKHPTVFHDRAEAHKKTSKDKGSLINDGDVDKAENGSSCGETPKKALATNSSGAGTNRKIYAAVPVKIKALGSDLVLQTYMGLDPYCSDTFMSEKLLKTLGVKAAESKITLTTMSNTTEDNNIRVLNNLQVFDLDENVTDVLSVVLCKSKWPFTKEDSPRPDDLNNLPSLKKLPFQFIDEEIGLLVGQDAPQVVKVRETVDGPTEDDAYATRHKFGWCLNGPVGMSGRSNLKCFKVKVEHKDEIDEQFKHFCEQDFIDDQDESLGPSMEDLKWSEIVNSSLKHQEDKHFQIALPFKEKIEPFSSNRGQVLGRLMSSLRKFKNDEKFFSEYKKFMELMIENNFAERVPDAELSSPPNKCWYLFHFGIFHKQKNKLRVVFDASLKYRGQSLNDMLYQGPDLTSSLLGVLIRFRQEKYAVMGDIQKMFFQLKVPKPHRDFMRFLWFPGGDISKRPVEFRVTAHIFGAVSSPSCANFALQQTSKLTESSKYCGETRDSVCKNFYVDDFIKSCSTEEDAVKIREEVTEMLADGGFKLTGFVSNSRAVLDTIPSSELSTSVQNFNLVPGDLPYERALGLEWNFKQDTISFRLKLPEKENTKRGVLSTTFSIYDPFGMASPAILPAKQIFQEACYEHIEWDQELPRHLLEKWMNWRQNIDQLGNFQVARCFRTIQDLKDVQLHLFSDGSEVAYAAVAYFRFQSLTGDVQCSFVMSKTSLVPKKGSALATIPRVELNGAKLAVRISQIIEREIEYKISKTVFWTDSTTVLQYIKSESTRFQRFVANRVAYIRERSSPEHWHHVPGNINIADLASRGATAEKFLANKNWKDGPSFLREFIEFWPNKLIKSNITEDDPEVKKNPVVLSTQAKSQNFTQVLLNASSSWSKTKVTVAWFMKFKKYLLKTPCNEKKLTADDLNLAEIAIWQFIQNQEFFETLKSLRLKNNLQRKDSLRSLNPLISKDNLLRVGGRQSLSVASYSVKHPIILPKNNHLVNILLHKVHLSVGHLGRKTMLSELRQKYWIIGANGALKRIVRDCIVCRKYQGRVCEQLMSDLPSERLEADEPAFSSIGLDCFGPFQVSRGRGKEKRYGVIFTCLASRAVHIELVFSLDCSSFIDAFRRFAARRGCPMVIRSDNGTNFVGAERDLRRSIEAWNCDSTLQWFRQKNITWKFNPPAASHFGGSWEREIRTIRKTLNGMLNGLPLKINDEGLNTLFCEIENTLNSRPLTEASSDPDDLEAITPNHLLLSRSGITFPPGLFSVDDVYASRRWRQVQYLADLFWTRWRKEYLPILQERQKWTLPRTNLQIGDLVLVTDQLLPRNQWSLGRIVNITKDHINNVRVADVKVAKSKGELKNDFKTTTIQRAVAKLVFLKNLNI